MLRVPQGQALVQTVDVLAPIVNDARSFGRIAAVNALSDVYAMGGTPWSAMSVAFFPEAMAEGHIEELRAILQGALEAMSEAGCVSAGGHTVKDDELKFGLAVSGFVDPDHIATNGGFRPGMRLLLTKPLGTGILATGVKAHWDGADEAEALIRTWAGRLNKVAGEAVSRFALTGATDITGFGLAGHALEVARASQVDIRLHVDAIPLMKYALEFASEGLVPAGSIGNRKYAACRTHWERTKDEDLENVLFDAQTSGGLLLGVPQTKLSAVQDFLRSGGDLACDIGEVLEADGAPLRLA